MRWLLLLLCCTALGLGCGTDRTVTGSSERWACTAQSDCETGFSCICNFCQPATGAVACLTDAGADVTVADAGKTDTGTPDAGTPDTGPTDAGGPVPTKCNVADWSGCPAGQGCYWDDTVDQTLCMASGSGALNATCDPFKLNDCGQGTGGAPLICDFTDAKCYHLCNTDSPSCPTAATCYGLEDQDKKPLPNSAGVCVPK
ncbi:MAG: hypothetical protein KC502_18455 [Myxococcales bacterium]|nr:hypothetical protein [Myxococcales bacterium]